MISAFKSFYYNHIQKTCGGLLVAMTAFDFGGYEDSIKAIFGEKGYHGIRLFCATTIILRSVQKTP